MRRTVLRKKETKEGVIGEVHHDGIKEETEGKVEQWREGMLRSTEETEYPVDVSFGWGIEKGKDEESASGEDL